MCIWKFVKLSGRKYRVYRAILEGRAGQRSPGKQENRIKDSHQSFYVEKNTICVDYTKEVSLSNGCSAKAFNHHDKQTTQSVHQHKYMHNGHEFCSIQVVVIPRSSSTEDGV